MGITSTPSDPQLFSALLQNSSLKIPKSNKQKKAPINLPSQTKTTKKKDKFTINQIPLTHAAPFRAIVRHALFGLDELVHEDLAVPVDDADARQDALGALEPDADHLAVDCDDAFGGFSVSFV